MPKFFLGHFWREIANAALNFKFFDHFCHRPYIVHTRLLKMISNQFPENTARIIDSIMGLNESSNIIEWLVICGIPQKSISRLNVKSIDKSIVRVVIRFIYIATSHFIVL